MFPEKCAGCRRWDTSLRLCIFGQPPSVKKTKYKYLPNCPCGDCFVRIVCVDLCDEFVHIFNAHWDYTILEEKGG
jgi:hypothetical protein